MMNESESAVVHLLLVLLLLGLLLAAAGRRAGLLLLLLVAVLVLLFVLLLVQLAVLLQLQLPEPHVVLQRHHICCDWSCCSFQYAPGHTPPMGKAGAGAGPPGGKGAIRRTGRAGQLCADAIVASNQSGNSANHNLRNRKRCIALPLANT